MLVTVSIAIFGIYMTLPVTYIFNSPLLKGCIAVIWWHWSNHFTIILAIGKIIVIHYVPQSTRILHVVNSKHLSQCTTAIYSLVSKQLVFPVKCSFNKQQFNLLSRFLHLISPSPLMIKLRIYVCPWTPKIWGTIVLHCISMYIDVSGNQKNNTQDHNMVPHHITNWAQHCLIALSRRE